jgi:hypothetical protein
MVRTFKITHSKSPEATDSKPAGEANKDVKIPVRKGKGAVLRICGSWQALGI